MKEKLKAVGRFIKKYAFVISWFVIGTYLLCYGTHCILHSYYHVDDLEYADVDFEWVDDFGNYEVVIVHEDKPHYLTIKDNKVKFIYTTEDLLNFVIVNYQKRIYDGLSKYDIKAFYINLGYKEYEE